MHSYKDFEIIIRDDGSVDNTMNIIKKRFLKKLNIRLIKNTGEPSGPFGSFAELLEMADADCLSL